MAKNILKRVMLPYCVRTLSQASCFWFFWLCAKVAFGQEPDTRWGKVSTEEWQLQKCNFDSTASAIILFEKGKLFFRNNLAVITYHRRIKLLNSRGLDYATVELPFIREDQLERISSVKAHTLLPSKDGRVRKIPVTRQEEFEQTLDARLGVVKFTFPEAVPGAIFEYKYEFTTRRLVSLQPWYFQHEIPCRYSHFEADIPGYLTYNAVKIGDRLIEKYPDDQQSEWFLENMPGYKDEAFVFQPLDYADQIRFQLSYYLKSDQGPLYGPGAMVPFVPDWEALAQRMLKSYQPFTRYEEEALDFLKEKQLYIPVNETGLQILLEEVQSIFLWNGYEGIYSSQSLDQLLISRKGNLADLNLALHMFLRAKGFDAQLMLISSREHGKLIEDFPLLQQFNRLINRVQIGSDIYFINAVQDPYAYPYYMLDPDDFNHYGLPLIREKTALEPMRNWPQTERRFELSLNAKQAARLEATYKGYAAIEELYHHEKGTFHQEEWDLAGGSLRFEFDGGTNGISRKGGAVKVQYKSQESQLPDTILFFELGWLSAFAQSPIPPNAKRHFPVEFTYPQRETIQLSIAKSKEMELIHLPNKHLFYLPEQRGRFVYQVQETATDIVLTVDLSLREIFFQPTDYADLYSFFEQVEAALSQQLVIRLRSLPPQKSDR